MNKGLRQSESKRFPETYPFFIIHLLKKRKFNICIDPQCFSVNKENFNHMRKNLLNLTMAGLFLCSFNLLGQDMTDSVTINSEADNDYIQQEQTDPAPVTEDVTVQEEKVDVDSNVSVTEEEAERIEAENNEKAEKLVEDEKAAKQSLRASKAELKAVKAEKRARKAEKRAQKAQKKAEREKRKMERSR